MSKINLKKVILSSMEDAISQVTMALQNEGFGILTRIDFHTKVKEKLNKDIAPVVILGACNPQLALDAFLMNSDVTSLLPCNAVVREATPGKISVELAKPSALMNILGDPEISRLANDADVRLQKVIETLR